MDTKDHILHTALQMFAIKGYTATSIRDICGAVGIKESSLYYHYKNKQDLLDTLTARFEQQANEVFSSLSAITGPRPDKKALIRTSDIFCEQFLAEPFCNLYLRILQAEQSQNAALRRLYHEWLFAHPSTFFEPLISKLISSRQLRKADAATLALSFYAPFIFFWQRYLTYGEPDTASKQRFSASIRQHLLQFLRLYA